MQNVMFTGRLAADPQITDDFGKAVFRLLESRGVDAAGKDLVAQADRAGARAPPPWRRSTRSQPA